MKAKALFLSLLFIASVGFAVDDLEKAREFYGETLGLRTSVISEEGGVMSWRALREVRRLRPGR